MVRCGRGETALLALLFGAATACGSSESDGDDPGLVTAAPEVSPLRPDPAWDCNMPAGIPSTEGVDPAFEMEFEIGDAVDVGQTQYGDRKLIPIVGGTVHGSTIDASILDGGIDWQLTLANDVVEVEQTNVLKTDDGALIYMRTCGVSQGDGQVVRVVPEFDAPVGSAHAWLNTEAMVGTREFDEASGTLHVAFYKVATLPQEKVAPVVVPAPAAGTPRQTWDCHETQGSMGADVFTETVAIAIDLAGYEGKNGMRTIIPIIGGAVTAGRLRGEVVSGGADYQLTTAAGLVLDARYTIESDDGELILVRNCGLASGLGPRFETRAAGPYAWLNEGNYLSSTPMIGAFMDKLAVIISIYEGD
jgi:hypothetical protein